MESLVQHYFLHTYIHTYATQLTPIYPNPNTTSLEAATPTGSLRPVSLRFIIVGPKSLGAYNISPKLALRSYSTKKVTVIDSAPNRSLTLRIIYVYDHVICMDIIQDSLSLGSAGLTVLSISGHSHPRFILEQRSDGVNSHEVTSPSAIPSSSHHHHRPSSLNSFIQDGRKLRLRRHD